VVLTPLFEFFDLSADKGKANATVRYGVPKKLRPLLVASQRWGRIKAEVVCSMTSKYAMALYELVQLRAGHNDRLEWIGDCPVSDGPGVSAAFCRGKRWPPSYSSAFRFTEIANCRKATLSALLSRWRWNQPPESS
jgi:hypothetical protein